MGKRFERYGTPGMVAAAVSLAIGAIGGATAAGLITGKQIKDSSVTGADVKDGSLTKVDFKKGTLVAGPTGDRGPAGPAGPAGAAGKDGAAGTNASITAETKYKDGNVSAPLTTTQTALATVDVQPGAYLLLARANFTGAVPGVNAANIVNCHIKLGDVDLHGDTAINDENGSKASLTASISLHATQTVAAAAAASFTCAKGVLGSQPDGTVTASAVTLTAVKIGSEKHTAIP